MEKRYFLLFISLTSFISGLAQYGYKCGNNFIDLYPENTSVRIVTLKDDSDLIRVTGQEGKEGKVVRVTDKYFLIDTMLIREVRPTYESIIYRSKHGYITVVLPEIIVSVEKTEDLVQLLERYAGILTLSKEKKDRYVLKCNIKSSEEVLRLLQEINMNDGVRWCKPGMLSEVRYESSTSNPLFLYQYYLQNSTVYGGTENAVINAVKAWDIISGNPNIKVAIIDQGVERNHEDLQGNVLDGYTCNLPTEKGDPINENLIDKKAHGTACAGIIAAIDNDKGIKGIASGVKILPVNISPDYVIQYYDYSSHHYVLQHVMADPEDIADAIDWSVENGADIISCSWTHEEDIDITNALSNAMTNGRSGKGCVVVASSGNGYEEGVTLAGYPAALQGVLCVGAVDRNGYIWNYSQRGPSMDLVAPSGACNNLGDVVTTDRSVPKGYNTSDNYTYTFGGTSAACPQVAGVAALMLSANPNLTVSQVRTKLRSTARDLGATGYDTTYGYGLVDAYAAVCSALSASEIVGPPLVYTSGQYDIVNLPSGVTVSWSLSDNYYNTGYNLLIRNYPSVGHCLIVRDPNHDLMNATLTAEIKYNGVTVQTLQKTGIYAYDDFWGQYSSGNLSGNINYTHYFNVRTNYSTTVTSPNLYGATVTYDSSGATPSAWGFHPDQGLLYFTNSTPNTPVVLNVTDGCGNSYVLYAFATNQYGMNISYGDNSITVSLNEEGESSASMDVSHPWTLEVSNALTGTLMATRSSMSSRSTTISTAGWLKGMYVVRVTIGNEVLTEKVVIK